MLLLRSSDFFSCNNAVSSGTLKRCRMTNLREAIENSPFRTQETFSAKVGIAESTVSKYARGLRKPSPKHIKIIEAALNVKLDELEG